VGAIFVLSACATAPHPPPDAPQAVTYRIGPPDKLRITVLPEPTIERDVVVRPDGRISFDLIGDVVVIGRSPDEVASEIQERIALYKRDARVTVHVASALTDAITVFGEVQVPGAFPLERDTRLAEAIGLRGGPTTFAQTGNVRVIRVVEGDTHVLVADLGAIQQGDLSTNYLLQQGDIVVVPPNYLARIGYAIQNVVFPFTTIISPTMTGIAATRAF
jgi:polysaccharide export outer membrane protein